MAIKSYVKIRPIKDDEAFSGSFNSIRKGINRTGITADSIGNNLVETHKLIRFEKEWLRSDTQKEIREDKVEEREDLNVFQKWAKGFKGMFKFEQRNKKEAKAEKKPAKEKQENPLKEKVAKTAMGFFEMMSNFLSPIFDIFVKMALFKWLSDGENAKKATKVFKLIFSIGKFAFSILGFGVKNIAEGITNIFGAGGQTGIAKAFAPITGFFQLIAGFATLRYLLNPLKLFSDGVKVKNLFRDTSMKELEWKKQEQWRKFGYKDTETGKIYTEQEYKAQKKSVERQQKKLRKQGRDDQARKVGNKFNQRVKNPTRLQSGKNIAKGIGKQAIKPGMQKGIAVLGGVTRIASGIASGEDATQAVGAGVGQAAGGMIGAALLTPFLGPFGPIVGNALGGFLGEWVGKTFLPVIKPIFEPIKKFFVMAWDLISGIAKETGVTEYLGTLFQFIGQIGKVMFDIVGWIMKPITWLLGGVIKILGGIISFIIKAAKNIFAFMINPIGFAWKVIRRKDPGEDVKLEEFGAGGQMVVTKGKPAKKTPPLQSLAGGGPTRVKLTAADVEPPQFIYSLQKFTSKTTEYIKNGELVELKKEKDFYEVMGSIYYHILLKHHDDILGKLISMRLLKPHHTIRDVIEGSAADHIKPEVLYPIFKESEAQKLSDEEGRQRTLDFYKRHNLKIGESWVADNFAKGGNIKGFFKASKGGKVKPIYQVPQMEMGGELADFNTIKMNQEKQEAMHAKFAYKQKNEADLTDVIAPPRTVILKTTVPVINNVAVGTKTRAVSKVPSPMFTC